MPGAEKVELPQNNSQLSENLQDGNSALAAMVKESAEKISGAKVEPPKRGPGRPRKTPPQLSGPTAPAPQPSVVEPPEPPPDISEFLKPSLICISNLPAQKHGIPELALNDSEATACAQSIQQILNAFFPDLSKMSPKAAACLGAALTVGSISVSKLNIYALKKQELLKQKIEQDKMEADLASAPKHFQAPPQQTAPNLSHNSPFQ